MNNTDNSVLSKDKIFGTSDHTDINSIFNSASSLESLSVAKAKEALQKMRNKNTSSLFVITNKAEV
jgi:hypothetical protein